MNQQFLTNERVEPDYEREVAFLRGQINEIHTGKLKPSQVHGRIKSLNRSVVKCGEEFGRMCKHVKTNFL